MTRHIIDHIGPHLRALAEALSDKLAGVGVQILVSWVQSTMGG